MGEQPRSARAAAGLTARARDKRGRKIAKGNGHARNAAMTFDIDSAAQRRLFEFMDDAGRLLGNEQRRASFALYAQGLWGEGR